MNENPYSELEGTPERHMELAHNAFRAAHTAMNRGSNKPEYLHETATAQVLALAALAQAHVAAARELREAAE